MDTSKDAQNRVDYVGYEVWFGKNDARNEYLPVPGISGGAAEKA